MKEAIQEFLKGNRFAIVGVSRSGRKFGNTIQAELKQRGYQTFVVHPEAKEIAGDPCYASLGDLSGQVDGAIICVSPRQAPQALREAAQAGIRNIWLQQGAQSSEAQAVADELGITPITGRCILMYAQPVGSFHAWHRAFASLFGQL